MSAHLEDLRPGDVVATTDGSEYEVVSVDLDNRAVELWSVNDGESFWTDEHVVRLGDSHYWAHADGDHIGDPEPGCAFCQDLYDEVPPDDDLGDDALHPGDVVVHVDGSEYEVYAIGSDGHSVALWVADAAAVRWVDVANVKRLGDDDPGPCQCDTCRAEEDLPPLADPLERAWANAWAAKDVARFLARSAEARRS